MLNLNRLTALTVRLAVAAVLIGQSAACQAQSTPQYTFEVVNSFPHDRGAFTQGLIFEDGHLFESTGHYGQSTVRRVDLETGSVLQGVRLPNEVFGEGLTIWNDQIIVLTWKEGVGYVLDRDSFQLVRTFSYPGEGWGLTRSDQELIMSDGTSSIRFLDPETFRETRRISVADKGRPIDQLNELEWIDGEIWANVWQTTLIARIDPQSGEVAGWINLAGMLEGSGAPLEGADVLNGIAYDEANDRLLVTGKFWPRVFEIRLVRSRDQ